MARDNYIRLALNVLWALSDQLPDYIVKVMYDTESREGAICSFILLDNLWMSCMELYVVGKVAEDGW